MDYKLVYHTKPKELETRVIKLMNEGWSVQGGVCLYYDKFDDNTVVMQAMVKTS